MKNGFDINRYIKIQSNGIFKRLLKFSRLYLEFGGKLISDGHAYRVLPGYKKNTKLRILKELKNFTII